jgi:hypothetical protein
MQNKSLEVRKPMVLNMTVDIGWGYNGPEHDRRYRLRLQWSWTWPSISAEVTMVLNMTVDIGWGYNGPEHDRRYRLRLNMIDEDEP